MISVIIVTYNSRYIIAPCLQSIPSKVLEFPVEVIVVDNASQDDTTTFIKKEFPHVKVIENPHNSGFGAGNNTGFRRSSGDFILLTNPDLILNEAALVNMINYLKENPEVGIVGPGITDGAGQVDFSAYPEYSAFRVLCQFLGLWVLFPGLVYGSYMKKVRKAVEPFEVAWLKGACLAISRKIYEQIQGFDEDFFLFVEDTDLCERTRQMGYKIYYLPSATVTHYGATTVSRYSLIRVRTYHQSPILYFRKRRRPGMIYLLKAGFMLELTLKMMGRSVLNFFWPDENRREHLRAEWTVFREILTY